ncbi:MAG TPA: spore germination protein [Thermoanaerobacterales bacterium]|nr:spore germination protein [Thermoanaerobacterales bacterium]
MLSIYDKIKGLFKSSKEPLNIKDKNENKTIQMSPNLDENIKHLKAIFDRCSDIIMREFKINAPKPISAFLIYLDGMVDSKLVTDNIVKALQVSPSLITQGQELNKANAFTMIKDQIINTVQINTVSDISQLVDDILNGNVALLVDGTAEGIISSIRKMEDRSIEESQTEPTVRGSRDGFVESLRTNITLIRRRIKTSRLKIELFKVGHLTKTHVAIMYIDGIGSDKVIKEVRHQISSIEIDGILESGYLEEFIEHRPYSLFPQIMTTERPDRMSSCLLEGRVAILVDNTPMGLMVPATLLQFIQTPEDYFNRFLYATFTRLLRFVTINIALLLPSIYIAIVTYHQEMLPTPLLISIAGQREGVPFPAFIEALSMELVFEFLREAGIRLPTPVGQTISIVGAIVIGQAAVGAGLVSSAMVMVVSLTAIASFTIPTISGSFAVRILRFPMMFLAASFGLFGIMAGLMGVIIHLSSMDSYGVPYLYPMAPLNISGMKDTFIRAPWWSMIHRPKLIGVSEPQRQKRGQKPDSKKEHRSGDGA